LTTFHAKELSGFDVPRKLSTKPIKCHGRGLKLVQCTMAGHSITAIAEANMFNKITAKN